MARLRNRIVKADFWNDGELLRWPREKRTTYQGLWAMAEDSGCLEDDPFGWKLLLWPSPVDADITVAILEQWRDELIEANKLIPYEADGKRYLYLKTFHQHEHPRNPQSPDLPLPAWVKYQTREIHRKDSGRGGSYTVNEYIVDYALLCTNCNLTVTVPLAYGNRNATPVLSCPVQSLKPLSDAEPSDVVVEAGIGFVREVFDYWREVMGHPDAKLKAGSKRARAIRARLKDGYTVEQLKQAVDGCRASPHHRGQNATGTVYDDLELICRDDVHVEQFMAKANGKRMSALDAIDDQWGDA